MPIAAGAKIRPGRLFVAASRAWGGAAVAAVTAGAALIVLSAGGVVSTTGPPLVHGDRPVTAMNRITSPANDTPALVEDPTNSRFVVMANRLDGPDFSCALQISGDGGTGWNTVNPVRRLPSGAEKCYAPDAAFDTRGALYYLFVGLHGAGNSPMGVYLTSSTDHARTFSPPRRILGAERYMVRMAIDPTLGPDGRIDLVWLEATTGGSTGGLAPPPNPIMSAYSDDGGATFSTPTQISDPHRPLAVGPALAIGPDQHVDVLYYDLEQDNRDYQGLQGPTWPGKWSLVLTTSTDGGVHFARGTVVDAGVVPPDRVLLIYTMPPPALAIEGSGAVDVAWDDARNGDSDVFFRRSVDGGQTFSALLRLNDDRLHNGVSQYLPHLAVSPQGRIDAVWYDRRNDAGENIGTDVYYTYSADGGRAFARNVRLTSGMSDSRGGPRYAVISALGRGDHGSRLALLSENTRVLAAWADGRNETSAPHALDIWIAAVDIRQSGGVSGWWAIPLGILLVVGGAGLAVVLVILERRSRLRMASARRRQKSGVA